MPGPVWQRGQAAAAAALHVNRGGRFSRPGPHGRVPKVIDSPDAARHPANLKVT